jgi:hypothetical protein
LPRITCTMSNFLARKSPWTSTAATQQHMHRLLPQHRGHMLLEYWQLVGKCSYAAHAQQLAHLLKNYTAPC